MYLNYWSKLKSVPQCSTWVNVLSYIPPLVVPVRSTRSLHISDGTWRRRGVGCAALSAHFCLLTVTYWGCCNPPYLPPSFSPFLLHLPLKLQLCLPPSLPLSSSSSPPLSLFLQSRNAAELDLTCPPLLESVSPPRSELYFWALFLPPSTLWYGHSRLSPVSGAHHALCDPPADHRGRRQFHVLQQSPEHGKMCVFCPLSPSSNRWQHQADRQLTGCDPYFTDDKWASCWSTICFSGITYHWHDLISHWSLKIPWHSTYQPWYQYEINIKLKEELVKTVIPTFFLFLWVCHFAAIPFLNSVFEVKVPAMQEFVSFRGRTMRQEKVGRVDNRTQRQETSLFRTGGCDTLKQHVSDFEQILWQADKETNGSGAELWLMRWPHINMGCFSLVMLLQISGNRR